MPSRFLQTHYFTSYPASLLNRDDVGFAKKLPFGGVTRTRISSQCLKRHWRRFEGDNDLQGIKVPLSIRSRYTFDREIYQPLVDLDKVDPEVARLVVAALMACVLGKSEKAKAEDAAKNKQKGKAKTQRANTQPEDSNGGSEVDRAAKQPAGADSGADEGSTLQTGQITVLGRPEVEYLLATARGLCKERIKGKADIEKRVKETLGRDGRKNLEALGCPCGLDAAVFGRMVTGDILARRDSAVHVAHAFTVHAEESESDYFSAVDDLEATGSGHISTTELTSGLYYGYVVVDLPLLISNLNGCKREDWQRADRSVAASVVERLVHLVATVSPGAKLGSTAPHSYAHCVLVESGNAQPRTLANAFLKPVDQRPDLLANTYTAVAEHVCELDAMYGNGNQRRIAAICPTTALREKCGVEKPLPLREVAHWCAEQVRGA